MVNKVLSNAKHVAQDEACVHSSMQPVGGRKTVKVVTILIYLVFFLS